MIFKAIFLLFLSKLILIEGLTYCCPPPHIDCSDEEIAETLTCEKKYVMHENDSAVSYTKDTGDLMLYDTLMLPDEYCKSYYDENNGYFIVCYEEEIEDRLTVILRNVCSILQVVSIFFIFLTIVVYLTIPKSLHLQDISILNMIAGLAIAYLTLSIINLSGYLQKEICHFMAYLLYFSFMYSFFWLNVSCFHIWREVVQPNCLAKINKWKVIYHVYGIGSPVLALVWVSFIQFGNFSSLQTIHPGIAELKCWFKSSRETIIYFIGPLSVLLIINIFLFVWTTTVLWKSSKHCTKTKIFKYRLRMSVKLFFIMGITWIFEILSTILDKYTWRLFWIITDIVNALQGLIIFLVLVLFRKAIKREFANRKFFLIRFPYSWKHEIDSECEELNDDINMETTVITKKRFDI